MNKTSSLITKLESQIPYSDIINEEVSSSSVGWHIEHALLTVDAITEALKRSNPENYKWRFNARRMLVYTMGKIPRGRAQAPQKVRPSVAFNKETLTHHIAATKEKLKELNSLQPNHYFEHPFFGKLNLKAALRCIEIHTAHHFKIIKDIIENTER